MKDGYIFLLCAIMLILTGCGKDKNIVDVEELEDNWGPSHVRASLINPITVKVIWRDHCDFEEGFIISRTTSAYTSDLYAILEPNIQSFTDSLDAWPNGNITYSVRAFHKTDVSSSDSHEIELGIYSPINLKINVQQNNTNILTWLDRSDDEDSFIIEKYIPNQGWLENYDSVPSSCTTYIDDDIDNCFGQYRVSAEFHGLKSESCMAHNNIDSLVVDSLQTEDYLHFIYIYQGYMYARSGNRNIVIYDLSEPETPTKINQMNRDEDIQKIIINNNHLFVNEKDNYHDYTHGFIYSLETPKNPVLLYDSDNIYDDYEIIGNYLYCCNYQGLFLYEFNNNNSLELLASNENYDGQQLLKHNNYLYMLDYQNGITIFDVTYPSNLIFINNIDPYYDMDCWRPVLINEWIYLNDTKIDISNPVSPNIYHDDDVYYTSLMEYKGLLLLSNGSIIDTNNSFEERIVGEITLDQNNSARYIFGYENYIYKYEPKEIKVYRLNDLEGK